MEIEQGLRDLDFTDNEIKIYITLLRIGRARAGRLSKEASLERTSTYNGLKRLIEKGMVSSTIEANKKVFSPADPSNILEVFREKQERARLIIPQLKELKKFEREKENILRFRGYSGVKTVLNDVLNSCKENTEYLIMGSEGQLSDRMPEFAEIFVARKDRKRLRAKILIREGRKTEPYSRFTQVKYVPQEVISPANITIYSNKVAIVLWSKIPEAVIIDDENASKTLKGYFDFMWKHAKKG
ncbi:hypothetical protein HZA33_03015 [Candidatus Pacearchaeota archaeon]|nr:hypothetical protein [Candidatus Pacearchaeota archaeon]